jgi:tripartite-type tricarboxylate transporter receptor subunit TctC
MDLRNEMTSQSSKMIQAQKRLTVYKLAALATSGLSFGTAQGQNSQWPNRPVKWIVSQPAGAGPDILARFLAEQMSRAWGQTVVVENRPGGQNVIGAQAAAKSSADGYTFFYGTTAAMVTNAFTFKTLPYDPEKDFTPVALIGRSPFVIAANPGAGFKSIADAIAAAKSQPEKIAIATEGPKTFSGMLADSFAATAGIKLNHVSYTKATDAIQDVIGGRVALICLPDAALATYIKNNQLQALAVSTAKRVPNLPNIASLADTFPGFEYAGWNGLFAPAGTPVEILNRVNRDINAALSQPELIQRMMTLGSIAESGMDTGAFNHFMRSERERWAKLVQVIGIKPE